MTKCIQQQSQTRSPQYDRTYQVWWKFKLLSWNENIDVSQADNYQTLTKFSHQQFPTIFTQYQCTYQVWWKSIDIYSNYHPKTKKLACRGQITVSKNKEICPLAIPNSISTISMQILSLVKTHWYLLKLSTGKEKSDVLRENNLVKNWQNLPINNPKQDLHNINAQTKFGGKLLIFTGYRPETKIWTDVRQTDGHTETNV